MPLQAPETDHVLRASAQRAYTDHSDCLCPRRASILSPYSVWSSLYYIITKKNFVSRGNKKKVTGPSREKTWGTKKLQKLFKTRDFYTQCKWGLNRLLNTIKTEERSEIIKNVSEWINRQSAEQGHDLGGSGSGCGYMTSRFVFQILPDFSTCTHGIFSVLPYLIKQLGAWSLKLEEWRLDVSVDERSAILCTSLFTRRVMFHVEMRRVLKKKSSRVITCKSRLTISLAR